MLTLAVGPPLDGDECPFALDRLRVKASRYIAASAMPLYAEALEQVGVDTLSDGFTGDSESSSGLCGGNKSPESTVRNLKRGPIAASGR